MVHIPDENTIIRDIQNHPTLVKRLDSKFRARSYNIWAFNWIRLHVSSFCFNLNMCGGKEDRNIPRLHNWSKLSALNMYMNITHVTTGKFTYNTHTPRIYSYLIFITLLNIIWLLWFYWQKSWMLFMYIGSEVSNKRNPSRFH